MASESREDTGVALDVPTDLNEWLDEHATTLDVDREELVLQILSSYHAAATLEGQLDAAQLLDLSADDFVDVETAVDEMLEERIDEVVAERVEEALEERLDGALDETVDERIDARIDERLADVAADREAAIDDLDEEFQAKLADVRERVVQVKKETDAKAPAAHTHEELQAVAALDERVNDLAATVESMRDDVEERLEDQAETTGDLSDRLDDAQEKLNRVAWVVSDIKDETMGRDAHEQAVDRIKRAAAQEGVATATCERCDESVHVGLLTDPECPHCNATVSDVRPAGGLLRKKARLVAASQLESGEDGGDA